MNVVGRARRSVQAHRSKMGLMVSNCRRLREVRGGKEACLFALLVACEGTLAVLCLWAFDKWRE